LKKCRFSEILSHINNEDQKVAVAVAAAMPAIEPLINNIVDKMLSGGRLFYIGAGTSGRLGIIDASECTVTFGIPPGIVVGIIAGGYKAITEPVEFAEDDIEQAWKDLEQYHINYKDVVIGIAASGSTPYVLSCFGKMPGQWYRYWQHFM
jgi:N-acetylmuramic acid 6-phosphate etherase